MKSLLLDRTTWDLCKDANGDIAVADEPYSLAQDAACECRLFQGELFYDTTRGIPYWGMILGKKPSIPLMKNLLSSAAELVPDVASAKVFITGVVNRQMTGQVQVTDANGVVTAASF